MHHGPPYNWHQSISTKYGHVLFLVFRKCVALVMLTSMLVGHIPHASAYHHTHVHEYHPDISSIAAAHHSEHHEHDPHTEVDCEDPAPRGHACSTAHKQNLNEGGSYCSHWKRTKKKHAQCGLSCCSRI